MSRTAFVLLELSTALILRFSHTKLLTPHLDHGNAKNPGELVTTIEPKMKRNEVQPGYEPGF